MITKHHCHLVSIILLFLLALVDSYLFNPPIIVTMQSPRTPLLQNLLSLSRSFMLKMALLCCLVLMTSTQWRRMYWCKFLLNFCLRLGVSVSFDTIPSLTLISLVGRACAPWRWESRYSMGDFGIIHWWRFQIVEAHALPRADVARQTAYILQSCLRHTKRWESGVGTVQIFGATTGIVSKFQCNSISG